MPHQQAGGQRRFNALLPSAVLWLGLLAGCSGGGDTALSAETTPISNSAAGGAFPQANDSVFALAADGSGGVYVGGQFTQVGGVPRQMLAHILADGTVDPPWDPTADGPVTALAVENQTLFIGGSFFSLDGIERWRLAAVDRNTGDLTPWNPKLGTANLVNALVSSSAVVYVGGVFDLVNAVIVPGTGLRGEARQNLAAIDALTGLATSWNPNIFQGEVKALAISGSVAYVGGSFDQVGLLGNEAVRLNLAAFDLASGLLTPWNPSVRGVAGDVVFALQVSDGVLYVGGRFDEVGGQARGNLAAVDRAGGAATSWNLPANDTVMTFFDDGRRLYLGGLFTAIGGQVRERLASIDKATGLLTSWTPEANGAVRSIVVSQGRVFVGGEFTTINGRPRNRLAVLDAETGRIVGEE
jgi:trimeric autotransporter adhesin